MVDLNDASSQEIYRVPTGKSFIPLFVVARNPSGDLSGGAGIVSLFFGFDGGVSDWNAPQSMSTTDFTQTSHFKVFPQEFGSGFSVSVIGAAGDRFRVKVDSTFGSAATLIFDVFGYLF